MKWQHVLATLVILLPAHAIAQHDSAIETLCRPRNEAGSETAIIETRLASVPALMRVPSKVTQPPILLWHGFGPPASEHALMEALPLDEVPAIKIYLGLPQFGAREAPGGRENRVRHQSEDLGRLVFEPVVVGAARELPSVIAALHELQCIRAQDKVGLFGFSAGGAAALITLAEATRWAARGRERREEEAHARHARRGEGAGRDRRSRQRFDRSDRVGASV